MYIGAVMKKFYSRLLHRSSQIICYYKIFLRLKQDAGPKIAHGEPKFHFDFYFYSL